MNRSVCEKCRRFAGQYPDAPSVWMCAEELRWKASDVIPGHRYIERDELHAVSEAVTVPPEWCERILEQTILAPDEKPDIDKDSMLSYDGNVSAESRRQWFKRNMIDARRKVL